MIKNQDNRGKTEMNKTLVIKKEVIEDVITIKNKVKEIIAVIMKIKEATDLNKMVVKINLVTIAVIRVIVTIVQTGLKVDKETTVDNIIIEMKNPKEMIK